MAILASSRAAGLPEIQVSPLQGALLYVLARSLGARRILEIGTLGGYSTTWLARGLAEGGRLVSLEIDPRHAAVASQNLRDAGVGDRVEIRVGPALDALERMTAEETVPFDLVFIDADKPSSPAYFDRAVALLRPGGLVLVDNVVRRGDVTDPTNPDVNVRGTRELLRHVANEPRVRATVIQSVGRKGHDGFLWAVRA